MKKTMFVLALVVLGLFCCVSFAEEDSASGNIAEIPFFRLEQLKQ